MTDIEKNRAVAEACGLPIEKRGVLEFAFVADPWRGFDDQRWRAIGLPGGYCPTRDANQAIEATGKVFDFGWSIREFPDRPEEQFNFRGRTSRVVGRTIELWGREVAGVLVDAILAAGGKS